MVLNIQKCHEEITSHREVDSIESNSLNWPLRTPFVTQGKVCQTIFLIKGLSLEVSTQRKRLKG